MNLAFFSAHNFEKPYLESANREDFELKFIDSPLSADTVHLAQGCEAVCVFVSDDASAANVQALHQMGVRFLLLRSAGYNHVDVAEAKKLGLKLARVPDYSPYSIAEHCVALMLALNRKLVHAHNRIMEQNFSLDGLVGFDMHGKTVGIVGTGKIGSAVAHIMHGFGCRILLHDPVENPALPAQFNAAYVDFDTLCREADILTLHMPLTPETKHCINQKSLGMMKPGVMLINTSRGGLVNTQDLIGALKTRHVGFVGMDVYEEEAGLFFEDHSGEILTDDALARLMTFPNVLITSHQAFLTNTALENIATTTLENLRCFQKGEVCGNAL